MASILDANTQSPGKVMKTTVNVGTTLTQLTGNNEHRRAIAISCPIVNALTIGWDTSVVLGQGLNLPVNGVPLVLNREQHGALVTQPIFAVSATAAQQVDVWEEVGV